MADILADVIKVRQNSRTSFTGTALKTGQMAICYNTDLPNTGAELVIKDVENIDMGQTATQAADTGFSYYFLPLSSLAGFTVVDYDANAWQSSDPDVVTGRTFFNSSNRLQVYDGTGVLVEVGSTIVTNVNNNSGGTINKGEAIWYEGPDLSTFKFNVQKASCREYDQNYLIGIAATGAADQGDMVLMERGLIFGMDTSSLDYNKPVYLDATAGQLTTTIPAHPCRQVIVGAVVFKDASNGILAVNIRDTAYQYEFEAAPVEKLDVNVIVDTGVTYMDIGADGGGDFHIQLKNYFSEIDATTGGGVGGKARVSLTAGTSTAPAYNYVYAYDNAGTIELTSSTTRPITNYAMIAEVSVLDSATTNTYGPLMLRRWTNARVNGPSDDLGLVVGIAERLRLEGAKYVSGVAGTLTIDTVPSPDTIKVTSTSGVVHQLWSQTMPALDTSTDGVWVANASGAGTLTQFQRLTDLGQCLELQDGTAIANNDRYNLVIFYCINSDGESKAYVNLSTGVYATDSGAVSDTNNYSVVGVPDSLRSTAFLAYRIPLRYDTQGGGQFTALATPTLISLLGNPIGLSGSAGGSQAQNEFPDNLFRIYDDADSTKEIAFDVSGVTTGTTRTYTAPDADGTIKLEDSTVSETITLLNSWVKTTGSADPTVTKFGQVVQISGTIKDGTTTDGVQICTLSSAYRPAKEVRNILYNDTGTSRQVVMVRITTDGLVNIFNVDDIDNNFLDITITYLLV